MPIRRIAVLFCVLLLACCSGVQAYVTLPSLFSDNMILQRNQKLPVWGWAAKGEKVNLSFKNQHLSAKAGPDGKWQLTLEPEPAGGPFTLTVSSKGATKQINNVLIGEVWLASGQSNMEWALGAGVYNGAAEIAAADYPNIRFYEVKNIAAYPARTAPDTAASWKMCNPVEAGHFSAAAYFFARNLYLKYKVPVGIITSDWGGTPAEAWISEEALAAHPEFASDLKNAAAAEALGTQSLQGMQPAQQPTSAGKNTHSKTGPDLQSRIPALQARWIKELHLSDKGIQLQNGQRITAANFDDSAWPTLNLPGLWEQQGLPYFDGIIYLRGSFTLTARQAADKTHLLLLGAIDDEDTVWLNGRKLGGTRGFDVKRKYRVPEGWVKEGKNTLVIKVTDTGGGGGFAGTAPEMVLTCGTGAIPLSGIYRYFIGVNLNTRPPFPKNPFDPHTPARLFNGMINPLIPYALKGVLWYQGESNTERSAQYAGLFRTLITDWRSRWGQGDFPFLFCQLANFLQPDSLPRSSKWAVLRESQAKALSLPNTGMACLIDAGDAADIHPKNKQIVGWRLYLAALKTAYNENTESSGPVYESMSAEGSRLRLRFTHVAGGLHVPDKYGYLKGFALAGTDKKWYYAQGIIENNTVVLHSEQVPLPVAVRYAWADNPYDQNLYNSEGLPAPPFRTDNWE